MQEHLVLQVGDIIKLRAGALSRIPGETPLTVVHVFFPDGPASQYAVDWPGRQSICTVLMQGAVDQYAKKLMREEPADGR